MKHQPTLTEHFLAAFFAVVLVITCIAAYAGVANFLNRPEAFMTVNVTVPDHNQGDDPVVKYERIIRRQASGLWVVEVKCPDCVEPDQCSGSGNGIYEPIETGTIYMNLSKYAGVECGLEPGRYVMVTYWNLTDKNGNTATISNETKPFQVR